MNDATGLRPRRSVLYMPGSNARALQKARTLNADALILDLEDAVAPGAKVAARAQVTAAVQVGGYGHREVVIRVNGLDTPWGADDVMAAAHSRADAVLFPKIESANELREAIRLLDAHGGEGLAVWIMAELPKAVLAIDDIARLAPRVTVIVMGTADLARSLRLPMGAERIGLLAPLSRCVLAARAWGLDILDGVYTHLRDMAGLRAACQQGKSLGFDGKTLIHPEQIDIANEIFGVSAEQAAEAARILAAWESAAAAGTGVAVVDQRMVERLHAEDARRILGLRTAISARNDNKA
jgi:citrate lyase subunit beta/citryl-CoA lyase